MKEIKEKKSSRKCIISFRKKRIESDKCKRQIFNIRRKNLKKTSINKEDNFKLKIILSKNNWKHRVQFKIKKNNIGK